MDVGSGDGSSSAPLRRPGAVVFSLDNNLEKLRRGIKEGKIGRGCAILANAKNCPFRDESLDMVSSGYLIHLVEDQKGCLEEMERIMKPQGRILITDLCAPVSEVREFLDTFHSWGADSKCQILTKEELLHELNGLGIRVRSVEWHVDKKRFLAASSRHMLKEN